MINDQSDQPPIEFIPEKEEFMTLRKHAGAALVQHKIQYGHINMALDLLAQTLHHIQGNTEMVPFIKRSKNVGEATKCNAVIMQCMNKAGWTKHTKTTVIRILKHVLRETTTNSFFIDRITARVTKKKTPLSIIMGNKFDSRADTDPVKQKMLLWIQTIRNKTKNKSDMSIRNMMQFLIKQVFKKVGIDLEKDQMTWTLPLDWNSVVLETCQGNDSGKKVCWIKVFVHIILQRTDISIVYTGQTKKYDPNDVQDDTDKHRVPASELDLLYKAVVNRGVQDKLMYLLLICTGMRVGGLCKIKLQHIAVITGPDVQALSTGRTIEKGKKWFSFCTNQQIQQLVETWIKQLRPAVESEYLFPGFAGGHISTAAVRKRFHQWCQLAGLDGSHLHPHALRHSYAHMLLEAGNSVEIVSKLLNHSNPKTTQQFYLRESAAEVARRANIPWMRKADNKGPVVPEFLKKNKKREMQNTPRSTTKKAKRSMASLDMFKDTQM
jgi:hypothetical protein